MPQTPFTKPYNDIVLRLSLPHVVGDGILAVADTSVFGTISPTSPIRVTVRNGFNNTLAIYKITGSNGTQLLISSAIEGTTDIAFPAQSQVTVDFTAGHLQDAYDSINALEVKPDHATIGQAVSGGISGGLLYQSGSGTLVQDTNLTYNGSTSTLSAANVILTGTIDVKGTPKNILFVDDLGFLEQDSDGLYWDFNTHTLAVQSKSGQPDDVFQVKDFSGTVVCRITPAGSVYGDGSHLTGVEIPSNKGAASGYASLDSGGKIPTSQLPAAVLGAVDYQGTWNASTNSPTLVSGVGTKGYYYKVSVAGNTSIDGNAVWGVGDWIVYDGVAWDQIKSHDAVVSVNGMTGAVTGLVQLAGAQTITGLKTFQAATGNTKGLIVQGGLSQTANFIDCVYSNNAAAFTIDVNGIVSTVGNFVAPGGFSATSPQNGLTLSTSSGSLWQVFGDNSTGYYASPNGLAIRYGSSTAAVQIASSGNRIGFNTLPVTNQQVTILSSGALVKNLVIQASPSQTADPVQLIDSTSVVKAKIDVAGNVTATAYYGDGSHLTGVSASLPSQTGNSGKYLTTDGSTVSWAAVVGGGGGSLGIGNSITGGNAASVLYESGTNTLTEDAGNFTYNGSTHTLSLLNLTVTNVISGTITGNIAESQVVNLTSDLASKAPNASPAFTGSPTAPTPINSDNTTNLATTAFVKNQNYLTTAPVTSVAGKTGSVTLVESDISGLVSDLSNKLTGVVLNTSGLLHTSPTTFLVSAGVATGTQVLATQTANVVLAGPTTGSAAQPTMRLLVAADIPNLSGSKITSGTVAQTYLPSPGTTTGTFADGGVVAGNTSAIALRALDSSVVHLAGTETIGGTKTFSATIGGSISGNATSITGSITESQVTNLTTDLASKESTANKGVASGYAGLDSGGKVPTAQLPSAILGSVNYQGVWNASTNSPALASGVGTKGFYYKVSVAGTTSLDGNAVWGVGDWAVYDGSVWEQIVAHEAVTSVAGKVGAVTLVEGDVANLTSDLAAKAADSLVVHLAGTETVTGTKTFSTTITGSITGNAGTATNGVVTTGSYADPAWLTSIAGGKVSGNISGNSASITGSISESQVTSLTTDLGLKAPLASPVLTGTPTAPTATVGTNTTQLATTAFVASAVSASGGGSVSSVSVTTANGISGTVANATTTPAITLTLGAITPTTIVASGAVSGSNLSGTNTGDQTITLTGPVTGSGTGSFATTIVSGAVTNTMLAGSIAATKLVGSDIVLAESQITNLTTDLSAKATDSLVVHLAGTETITGTKTFSTMITGSVSGNAGTVTNGVVTTGSYSDPAWITSIAGSKVSGNISGNSANVTGTVAIANGGTGQTTASTAINALVPTQTSNSGKVLGTNGTSVSWVAGGGGGGMAIGSAVTSGTSTSILFVDASGNLGQNSSYLTWNDTTKSLTVYGQAGSNLDGPVYITSTSGGSGYGIGFTMDSRPISGYVYSCFSTGVNASAGSGKFGVFATDYLTFSNYVLAIDRNGQMGVGLNNFVALGQLGIVPYSASTKGLVIQGAPSQSANLQEWQDSTTFIKASVSSNGTFTGGGFVLPFTFGGTGIPTIANDVAPWLYVSYAATAIRLTLTCNTAPTGNFQITIKRSADNGSTFPDTIATITVSSGNKIATTTTFTNSSLSAADVLRCDIISVNAAANWTARLSVLSRNQ